MGKTAEELRWEIDQKRSDLTRDFDAIGDRVSPGRMVERQTEAVKSRFRSMKESVMGTADDLGGSARDRTLDVRDQVGGTAHDVRESAADLAQSAQSTVQSAAGRVGEVPDLVKEQTQGNPLAAGLVAFGIGLLAASVLPESRRERQLARKMEPQLQQAASAAGETGRHLAEELKPVAQEHATNLQESAKESVQQVAEQAKGTAQGVAHDARSSAENVKDAARS
jgi:gas vesicle protein